MKSKPSDKIRLLDKQTINQIAAGEVVERPSSVVKELVENALDAGAETIEVEISDGGLALIRVSDNGEGMTPDDARRAVEKHATSKIRSASDLESIHTFGFRGEALSSIASVSRFEMTTRVDGADAGVSLRVHGGGPLQVEPAVRPKGTTVSVSNLFHNTPARLKFMKKSATENDRCALVVTTYALAFPGVGFHLSVEGRVVMDSPPGSDSTRRRDVFGRDLAGQMLPVSRQFGPLKVEGSVSAPSVTKSTRESIYFFVNKRWVMNPALGHALLTAYQTLLPSRRFPAAALFLTLPPDAVDVNIHPTKREVKFAQDRAVYDAVVQAVRAALLDSPLGPPDGGGFVKAVPETPYGVLRSVDPPLAAEPMPIGLWGAPRGPSTNAPSFPIGHGAPASSAADMNARRIDPDIPLDHFTQFFSTFIVFQSDSELFIADQHTVHERLNFEKIMKRLAERRVETQPLLVPVTVEVPPREAAFLAGHLNLLEELGLEVEPFGGSTFVVKAVPSDLGSRDPGPLLKDLADQIARDETQGVKGEDRLAEIRRRAAAYLSCRSAVMAGDRLNGEQMRGLIDRMRREKIPFTCPHGRPTLMSIPLADLYRKFDRH